MWCENERAAQDLPARLAAVGQRVVVGRTVAETAHALADHPAAGLLLACFAGVPLAHAQAACRRFREAAGDRHLRLLGLLEPSQIGAFDPGWGLDDFLVLPADPLHLAARLSLLAWRERNLHTASLLKLGPLVVDLWRHEVALDNRPLTLTLKEYELLLLLVNSRDRVLTREAILDQVWGADYYGGERTVDVHIRRLRAKLGSSAPAIETVHGVGYRFTPALL